jgi:NDP-sugar pyrophosphorylase family protein
VDRVIVSCAAGQGPQFEAELGGLGPEIVAAEEPEPLGRGGGLRYAARERRERGPCLALNGDELLDVELTALLAQHERSQVEATIVVARPRSPFGVVDLDGDFVTGFREGAQLDQWVSCGVYVLGPGALARLPERGDHETTTFPELAAERRLAAYRHEGLWLTVNTPKDLRAADEELERRGASLLRRRLDSTDAAS